MRCAWIVGVGIAVLTLAQVASAQDLPLPAAPSPGNMGSADTGTESIATGAGQDGSCFDPSCGCDCCCQTHGWYFEADALVMKRDNNNGDPLVVPGIPSELNEQEPGAPPSPSDVLLSNSALTFNETWAPRFTLGRQLTDVVGAELSYFGMLDFTTAASVTGVDDLALPGALGTNNPDFTDYTGASRITVIYDSKINSAEANLTFRRGPFTFLGGFRYIDVEENYDINVNNNFNGEVSDYNVHTHNHLFGGQTGVKVEGQYGRRIDWRVTGKAGVFGNIDSERNFVNDLGNTDVVRDVTTTGSMCSFVSELDLSVGVHITSWLIARSSFDLMWMEGLALAPQQLDFTNTGTSGTQLNSDGGMFLYGGSVGLEAVW